MFSNLFQHIFNLHLTNKFHEQKTAGSFPNSNTQIKQIIQIA